MSGLVIVDTDVWSEGFRKRVGDPSAERLFLAELVEAGRVQMLGCIRQEVLQGIRDRAQFERTRTALQAFEDRAPRAAEYELAAEFFNTCRGKGIQGSSTDFLIAACSVAWGMPLLTKDKDFQRYAEHIPLRLVRV
ncbi:putative nucleic acid-binding protein [Deinococcus sp. HSC-46F16]|uniref:type II toxin-antitoxin system VapC family toxin n=1 Tax=Deinococcus sp. HSC-46F16 TaxID=2910968 RepID=UPI00209DAB6B|nr:putative nucleic acid-binding protein [Deinococcus sp. HSC-46F16]